MFGDPSGLAPEKHKSGGGGQDMLLGSYALAALMAQYAATTTATYECVYYQERVFIGFEEYEPEGVDYRLNPLTLSQDSYRAVYGYVTKSKWVQTSGGGGGAPGPSASYSGGGGASNNRKVDFGYWDDSNINPEGWADINNEMIGKFDQLVGYDLLPNISGSDINNLVFLPRDAGNDGTRDFSIGQKHAITLALLKLKNSPTFMKMYDHIASTTMPIAISPDYGRVGMLGGVSVETYNTTQIVDIIYLFVHLDESYNGINPENAAIEVVDKLVGFLAHEFTHIYDLLIPYGDSPSVWGNDWEQNEEKITYPVWINRPCEKKAEYYRGVILKELGY